MFFKDDIKALLFQSILTQKGPKFFLMDEKKVTSLWNHSDIKYKDF